MLTQSHEDTKHATDRFDFCDFVRDSRTNSLFNLRILITQRVSEGQHKSLAYEHFA